MQEGELGRRAARALWWSYGGAALRALATLLVQLLLARLLGPEAFGQAAAAFIVLALGWMLAEGGFGAALIQKPVLSEEDVSHALGWVLLLSGTAGLGVMLSAPWLARWLGSGALAPLLVAAGALIPVQALSSIPVSLMRRDLDAKRAQLIYLGGYVFAYALVGLPLAWSGAGAWTLIIAFGLHSLVNMVGSYAVVRHTLRPRLAGDPALRRFGLQVVGTSVANWALENLDRVLVNRLWGAAALGQYSAAFTLSRSPAAFLVGSLQNVAFAAASRVQDDLQRLGRSYLATVNLLALLSWPAFALMACHADTLVHLLYGTRWQGTEPLFAAFCAGLPFFVLMAVSGPLLWALDAVRQDLMVQLAGGLLLFAGFLCFRAYPLKHVVWLVPVVYLLRALWFQRLLGRRLQLQTGAMMQALRGGLLLVLMAAVLSLGLRARLTDLPAMGASAALSLLLALAVLRQWPALLLGPALMQAMQAGAPASAASRRLCAFIGLESRES